MKTGYETAISTTTIVKTPDLIWYQPDSPGTRPASSTAWARPTARDTVIEGSSAVHWLVIDYGFTRDQIRTARE